MFGNVSARIREMIWQQINEFAEDGNVVKWHGELILSQVLIFKPMVRIDESLLILMA